MSQNPVKVPESGPLTGLQMAQDVNLANDTIVTRFLGATAPNPTYPGMEWIDSGTTIDATGGPWIRRRNTADTSWLRVRKADVDDIVAAVTQLYTAFTTGGSSGAFTLTPLPAMSAYSAPMRYHVKFHVAGNGSDTINISGLGTKNLKQYDAGGNKVAPVITTGFSTDIFFDGTDVVILDPLPSVASSNSPPVRQTVLSGPVDGNGYAAFGGSTGSTTVTASGTLKATAAAGGDANYTGPITNPSWTGLSTNGTVYLYLDITSAGVVTTGSTTLAPAYQWGGTYSTTNNQNTFNIQEMTMKVGNGSAASQVYRVFAGEVTVTSNVVSSITWYALQGRYISQPTALPGGGTRTAFNHNIGSFGNIPLQAQVLLKNVTAEAGYTPGQFGNQQIGGNATYLGGTNVTQESRNTCSTVTGSATNNTGVFHATTGAYTVITNANWNYVMIVNRGW